MVSNRVKGISTLIGAVCMHLVMGSLYSLGLLSPFMMSLINHYHPDVSLDDGFFLIP